MVFRASSHGCCATPASRCSAPTNRVFEAMVDGWRTQLLARGTKTIERHARSSNHLRGTSPRGSDGQPCAGAGHERWRSQAAGVNSARDGVRARPRVLESAVRR
jgi:hypothetical protein